jgi:predicted RNA binding protein YcfA (HicA-like mRNA interferase family)
MKTLTGKELCKLLESNGNQALKIGLLRHLLKQAGISEDEMPT